MHYVGQAAYWLFVLCLLRGAEAPEACFDRLVQSQRFLFEAEEIRRLLERIARVLREHPREAIGAAEELIESTAKVVLVQLGRGS
ncbi:hypothetical protein AB0H12_08710 [Actinosynnema sp. NPDC023794]